MKQKIIRIGLSGSHGKMGLSLQRLIKKNPALKVVGKAHKPSCFHFWKAENIDGLIDFSAPAFTSLSLAWAIKHKKAFVSGTTGLNLKQKQELQKASKKIPVFYSENMSLGVYLFSEWMRAIVSSDFQISLEDHHHKDKRDKPSGTAIRLKNHLTPALQKKIKIKSFRKGKEFGTHQVQLKNKEEILTITHKALNREVFSKGALKALEFLLKKKKGFYDTGDLYSIV